MENYWLKRLEHIQVPDWPYTSPDTVTVTFTVPVPPAVMQAMQAVAGNSSVNMLKLLLGGLGVVLWKYTGLQHAAIALPPLALPGENADDNSTLYCVLHLYATLQVPALLEQVHEALNDAHLHAGYNETTFRDAFRAANNDRLLAGNVALSYDGLTAPDNWLHEHQLHFEFNAAASHIKVNARNLPLPEKMLRNMAESLLFVAASFSANKEKSIAQCATEPPQSLHAWMARFNDHRRQYATGLTVVDLFLQQALEHPENTALVFGDTVYSYGGLDEWSARIAAYILQHTSRSQPLFIGVMMHRSAALVAAVLGILRAGAAYVPIDPAYPADRKKSIVADTQCPLIITDDDASATGIEICSIVNIATVTAVTAARPLPQVVPADVAYVIFSSGTTGKPKGIMIQHQAILNLLYWYNERYDLAAGAKIAQLTNIAVDIAFQEIFSSLMNGLPLYIPRQEEQQDRHVFVEWLKHHEISFIQLIPDMLATYLQDIPRITTLKQILCGGDKLSESLKDEIVSKGYTLYNIYGQTETAIDTVGAICRYGEPMCFNDYVPNYDVYILDEHGHLCPEYVAGEICTGGQGLALGYLHNPVLTAERFIAHPFEPGRRLYRTGDRARRMPDGSILLLGREDEQVKIRGYRIELGEIEGLLQRFPGIDNAAVIVKEDSTGEKQLAAFLAGSGQLDIQACRAYVKEHLPSYMLPDHFLQLDKLPLTDTGKIDRKRLAAYEGMKPSPSTGYVAPRNETEAQLADMWQQVIGKEKVGVTDDFFDLGGHSLKVTRLGSLIRKTFGVAVSLKDLFVHSVLEAQAALIAESRKEQQQAIPVLPLQDSYELSSSQHRLWVLSQLEGSNIAYNMPGVLVFEGVLDKEALFSAFTMLVARHEILRTVFRADPAGTVKQYVLDATLLNFRVKEQDLRGAEQQEELLQSCLAGDFYTEFDLAAGPLLRAGLYRLTDSKWVFSYVMHHIISDDWSMGVFFNDLLRLYNGFTGGGEALPPLRIQYKDYASWQRSRLTGTGTGKAYWQEVF
ncbi:amino acid adenylation domain-containing protein, partial [Chitinophaga eiseniae]